MKSSKLELSLGSDWTEVARCNREVEKFLRSTGMEEESVYRCTMIACELVENGIKYSHFRGSEDTVHVYAGIKGKEITIQVSNPAGKASDVHLRELDRTIQWVRGFQDPFEAYLERMKAISREPLEMRKSELGLIRVTYEGRAALDFVLDEDNTVSVSAVSTFE